MFYDPPKNNIKWNAKSKMVMLLMALIKMEPSQTSKTHKHIYLHARVCIDM